MHSNTIQFTCSRSSSYSCPDSSEWWCSTECSNAHIKAAPGLWNSVGGLLPANDKTCSGGRVTSLIPLISILIGALVYGFRYVWVWLVIALCCLAWWPIWLNYLIWLLFNHCLIHNKNIQYSGLCETEICYSIHLVVDFMAPCRKDGNHGYIFTVHII